jgi:TonB family protein
MISRIFIIATMFLSLLSFSACNSRKDSVAAQARDLEEIKVDKEPVPTKQINPAYPDSARRNGFQGQVLVKALLGVDGMIKEVKVMKNETNSTELATAAMKAALDWQFTPATVNQKPTEVYLTIPFRFKLSNEKQDKQTSDDFAPVDEQPMPIKQVQPHYPELARRAGVEGTVWLKVLVSEEGTVKNVKVMNVSSNLKNGDTPGGLEGAAIEAARQWTFKPAMMKNKPVEVWAAIPFRFKLDGDKKKE